jgi:hypothetical protein
MDVGVQLSRLSLAQRFQLRLFDFPFFDLPFSTPRNLTVGQVSHFPCVRDPSLLLKIPSSLLAAQAICIFFSLNVMAILVSLFDSGGDLFREWILALPPAVRRSYFVRTL